MNYPIRDIFSQGFELYRSFYEPNIQQRKVASAISSCKTQTLGANVSICHECGHKEVHYNSCRNRHCPSCQLVPQTVWIEKRKLDLLPAPYFHAVFTVPDKLNSIFMANPKEMYNLLYDAAKDTLMTLAIDSKHLGAEIGFISLLHTFGQNLSYHPHLHVIVLGGGLTKDFKFKSVDEEFLFPIKVVSRLFRGKFLHKLKKLYSEFKLDLKGQLSKYKTKRTFNSFLQSLYEIEWVPYLKETFNSPEAVIEYLGRYTHRVAISNSRIIDFDDEFVSFRYKDYKSGEKKVMKLSTVEFIRRFLMHVLPKGFVKIRHYGILSNRSKGKKLAICKNLLIKNMAKLNFKPLSDYSPKTVLKEILGFDITICKRCGAVMNQVVKLE